MLVRATVKDVGEKVAMAEQKILDIVFHLSEELKVYGMRGTACFDLKVEVSSRKSPVENEHGLTKSGYFRF